jgi:hypothetical protein
MFSTRQTERDVISVLLEMVKPKGLQGFLECLALLYCRACLHVEFANRDGGSEGGERERV